MYRNVLVPVDLTDRNVAAVEEAARLVAADGVVRLLHVIEEIAGIDRDEEADFYEGLQRRARRHLEGLGARLDELGTPWEAELVYGSRPREIVRAALEIPADLVVLASHRVEPDRPGGGWATLSYQVAVLAPCSVLLVK